MMENPILIDFFGRQVSPYALFILAGAVGALGVFCFQARKLKPLSILLTVALGIPLGLLGARAFYVLARFSLFEEIGFDHFFRTNDEELRLWGAAKGAAFWGTVGGVALAALIAGKISGEKTRNLLDALAAPAALGIALSRFGEFSIGEGIGPDVTPESLWFFPIAVVNEWQEWKYAVFLLEGIVGLIIFVILLTEGQKYHEGYRARMFLILYSATQILLESLRRDNFLRWLVARVSQVTAAVVLLGLIVFGILRWAKKPEAERMSQGRIILWSVLFLLAAGGMVWLEFAVDKSADLSVAAAYLLEAGCCAILGVSSWQIAMKN